MKQDKLGRGGLWTLLGRWIGCWFGPIERGKYRGFRTM